MVAPKRSALTRAAHPRSGYGRGDAPAAGESGGVGSIAATFKMDGQQRISLMELMTRIRSAGIEPDDPRVREMIAGLPASDGNDAGGLTIEQFTAICEANGGLIARALRGDLVIPDFPLLKSELQEMSERVMADGGGAVADYIPQLKRVDPEKFGIGVCTVDGQRFNIGDTGDLFPVQSMCKPVNYCLALEEHGVDGRAPSRRAGAQRPWFQRAVAEHGRAAAQPDDQLGCDHVLFAAALGRRTRRPFRPCGRDVAASSPASSRVGFNNSVYLSERQTADRNFALGYFMRENGAFPEGTDLLETLEFYFQCCSIELDAQALAVVAATLANAGVIPSPTRPSSRPARCATACR